MADAFAVRITVFSDEQGFDPSIDVDDIDPTAHHIILYDGSRAIATGRVFPEPGNTATYHIGRVAVLKECRGGTGRRLMGDLEDLARSLGARRVVLGAQCQAQGFYAKLGYTPFGQGFLEEGCPHIHMSKELTTNPR